MARIAVQGASPTRTVGSPATTAGMSARPNTTGGKAPVTGGIMITITAITAATIVGRSTAGHQAISHTAGITGDRAPRGASEPIELDAKVLGSESVSRSLTDMVRVMEEWETVWATRPADRLDKRQLQMLTAQRLDKW